MLQNVIKGIQASVEETRLKRRSNRNDAYKIGKDLLSEVKSSFESLATELNDKHSEFRRMANSLASELLQCGIDYFKAHMTGSENPMNGTMELFRSAGQIAIDPQIKQRVDDNVQGIQDWMINRELSDDQNTIYDFERIQLQTAFSFMTCDGNIDPLEVSLIKRMSNEMGLFGNVDIDTELDYLVEIINNVGSGYLKDYFKVIKNANLSVEQEIQLVDIAYKTLNADQRLDYNEIRFFRIFRTLLNVTDEQLENSLPSLPHEFLETDIFTNSYLKSLFDDYFQNVEIPTFEKIGE